MPNVDWSEIIFQLQRKGLHPKTIGKSINVSRVAVIKYRDHRTEPTYSNGAALIELWRKHHDVPCVPEQQ